jgi:hypothetical protein
VSLGQGEIASESATYTKVARPRPGYF